MCECQSGGALAMRVDPSTVFEVYVDQEAVKATLEIPEDLTVEFVVADVDHEEGLRACGMGIVPQGRDVSPFWSLQDENSTTYPLLAHQVAPSLYDAHRYPGPFRGREYKANEKLDVWVQHRNGIDPTIEPYTVRLTFFARRRCA